MKADEINRWLTLGANLGVLIGIFLLVVELDQNRQIMRAQIRNDISQQISDRLLEQSQLQLVSLWRRAGSGEELSEDESQQHFISRSAGLGDWENIHYQFRQGMFDEEEFEAERNAWAFVIGSSPGLVNVWCVSQKHYSDVFAAEIETILPEGACSASGE